MNAASFRQSNIWRGVIDEPRQIFIVTLEGIIFQMASEDIPTLATLPPELFNEIASRMPLTYLARPPGLREP